MTDCANNVGAERIKDFHRADKRHREAVAAVKCAAEARTIAAVALAKWIAPQDAKPGEKFAIWDRDGHGNECLVEVSFSSLGLDRVHVELRYR